MSRRISGAAEQASLAASEAARVLQQRGQEARSEATELATERSEPMIPESRIEKLRNNNPRDKIMDEIIASRGPQESPKTEPEKPEEEPKSEVPANVEAVPAAEVHPIEAPKTVKVKVDGVEFDAPAEDVEAAGGVRSYQMERASENRLKKASEALAESRRTQSEVTQFATAMLAQRQPAKPQESDQQFIESKLDVIRFGTPAEGAAALMEIQQRTQPKALDRGSLVAEAAAYIHHDQAVKAFDRKYQDIVTNPIRLKTVIALRQEKLDRHKIENPNQQIDWDSFYDTIGVEVRSAFGGSSQVATPPAATSGTPSPASEREARKASIVNLPAAAARAEAPKEDKPETREDIIKQMRKERGLPVD